MFTIMPLTTNMLFIKAVKYIDYKQYTILHSIVQKWLKIGLNKVINT